MWVGRLFDTTGFVPRWACGDWSQFHGYTHIVGDIAIFLAYAAIPISLAVLVIKRGKQLPFGRVIWLFVAFIASCGLTHLVEAIIFYEPVYRLSAFMKVVTALVSWATVFALLRVIPGVLAIPELQAENERLKTQFTRSQKSKSLLVRKQNELQHLVSSLEEKRQLLQKSHVGAVAAPWRADFRTGTLMVDIEAIREQALAHRLVPGEDAWAEIEEQLTRTITSLVEQQTGEHTRIEHKITPLTGLQFLIVGDREAPNTTDFHYSGIVLWIRNWQLI